MPKSKAIPQERLSQSVHTTLTQYVDCPENVPALQCAITNTIITREEMLEQSSVLARGLCKLLNDPLIFNQDESKINAICYLGAEQVISVPLLFWATQELCVPFAPVDYETFAIHSNDIISDLNIGIIFIRDILINESDFKSTLSAIHDSKANIVILSPDPRTSYDSRERHLSILKKSLPNKQIFTQDCIVQLGLQNSVHIEPRDNNIALYISTAATTGPGKFAAITNEGINTVFNNYIGNPVLSGGEAGMPFASSLSFKWLTGIMGCYILPQLMSGKVVLDPRTDIRTVIGNINKYKIKQMFLAQSQILELFELNLPDNHFVNLNIVFTGGEVMYLSRFNFYQTELNRLGVKLFVSAAGLTETTNNTAVCALKDGKAVDIIPGSNLLFYALAPDVKARVADPETNQEVAFGTVGELQIKECPRLFAGYVNKPDLTKASWTSDRFYKTGDANIAVKLPDGMVLVAFCCRYPDNITGNDNKRYWVFEVDAAVQSLPLVLDVLTVVDPKDSKGFVSNIVLIKSADEQTVIRQIADLFKNAPFNVRVLIHDSVYDRTRDAISKRNAKGLKKLAATM